MTFPVLTSATLIDIRNSNIPEEFSEFMSALDSTHALMIYQIEDNTMKVFPVNDKNVYLVRLVLDAQKVEGLSLLICRNMSIRVGTDDAIFITTPMKIQDNYYYECYLHESSIGNSTDEFKDKVFEISGIKDVAITQIK